MKFNYQSNLILKEGGEQHEPFKSMTETWYWDNTIEIKGKKTKNTNFQWMMIDEIKKN
jgi:hypothetical protein